MDVMGIERNKPVFLPQTELRAQIPHHWLRLGNCWGLVVSVQENGDILPIMCGHGGSMWLCPKCAEKLLREGWANKQ